MSRLGVTSIGVAAIGFLLLVVAVLVPPNCPDPSACFEPAPLGHLIPVGVLLLIAGIVALFTTSRRRFP